MPRLPIGVIGRVFAILLLAVLVEYGATAFLYERASRYSVRDDEAHRLAEHLVIARKLISEAEPHERAALADELTTSRYIVRWYDTLPAAPPVAPSLDRMYSQVLAWEPDLADHHLRLKLTSPGRNAAVSGTLSLGAKGWIYFRTREPLARLDFAFGRILLALIPAIALIVIAGLLLRHMLRPLRRLADAAGRVGHGEVEPVTEAGPGEVRRVIGAFNAMQDRIHRLIADRTEALAAVGHDFRTPLARLRLRADAVDDDDIRESIQRDVSEMDDMVGSLLTYLGGEEDAEARILTDVAAMCQTIVDDAADHGRDAGYDGPDHAEITVRAQQLRRAIVNLVENALHYGGNARVRVQNGTDALRILVDDDGPGIPDESRAQVLEPFVRLDSARSRNTSGFGLGLPIVVRAVEGEGGTLSLRNRPAGGLSAEILLPRG